MGSWLAGSAVFVVCLGLAGIVLVRSVAHDPDVWHTDPADTLGTNRPNQALAAPVGTTQLQPDIVLSVTTTAAVELLAAVDTVARAEPRVEVVAGAIETGTITYVQRSPIVGFPDYISVSATETPAGNGLVLWSRSRFGYSDLGVNRARLQRWLGTAGLL